MSRLFRHSTAGWVATPLPAAPGLALPAADAADGGATARVFRAATDTGAAVDVLLAPPAVAPPLVNGLAVAAGLRVLADKDAILCGAEWFIYSAADPALVLPFPRSEFDGPVECPRCHDTLADGPAVRCPGCGTWFHQDGRRDCFTYAETCPVCLGPTALDDDPWTPDEL